MVWDISVLCVDDKRAMLDLTAEMLERVSPEISVQQTSSPLGVEERLEEEMIHCIVSDYRMPEMTGIELCEEIRERHPELPFIVFTSMNTRDVIEGALDAGATDYIWKRPGVEHFRLLAHSVTTAVEHYRLQHRYNTHPVQ